MANPSGIGTFQPPQYEVISGTERAIGTNSAGKTIYQKVFTGTTPSTSGTYTYLNMGGASYTILDVYGQTYWNDSGTLRQLPLPYSTGDTDRVVMQVTEYINSSMYLQVQCVGTIFLNKSFILVVEYTK